MANKIKPVNKNKSFRLFILVIVTILAMVGSIYGLRNNNLRMVELRNQVFIADSQAGDTETALQNLRAHVINHMNTSLSRNNELAISGEKPIQLAGQYYRDTLQRYQTAANNSNDPNLFSDLLDQAESQCQSSANGAEQLNCLQQTLADSQRSFPPIDFPQKDLYTFDFESPSWSPDLAGFSLLVFGVCILLLCTHLLSRVITKFIR